MAGRLFSFWEGNVSGALLNFRWVSNLVIAGICKYKSLPIGTFPPRLLAESTKRLSMRKKISKDKKHPWASAASWVRQRRANVQAAVAVNVQEGSPKEVQELASQLWSQGHQKERRFNRNKELHKRTWVIIS